MVRLSLSSNSSVYNRINNTAKTWTSSYGIKMKLHATYNIHMKIYEYVDLTVRKGKHANFNRKLSSTKY